MADDAKRLPWFTDGKGNAAPAVVPPWEREWDTARERRRRRRQAERQAEAGDGGEPGDTKEGEL